MGLIEELRKANADFLASKARIEELENALRQLNDDGPACKLAVALYEKLHRVYDRDGEWGYEVTKGVHHWDRGLHKLFLGKAERLIRFCQERDLKNPDVIIEMVEKVL